MNNYNINNDKINHSRSLSSISHCVILTNPPEFDSTCCSSLPGCQTNFAPYSFPFPSLSLALLRTAIGLV